MAAMAEFDRYEQDRAEFEEQFARWFRANRRRAGSQTRWVRMTGASEQTIRNWEQGLHTPDGYYFVKILQVLGATPEDILAFEETEDTRRYLVLVGSDAN